MSIEAMAADFEKKLANEKSKMQPQEVGFYNGVAHGKVEAYQEILNDLNKVRRAMGNDPKLLTR